MGRPTDADRFVTQDEAVGIMRAAGIETSKRSVARLVKSGDLASAPTPRGYRRILRVGLEEFLRTHVDNDAK